MYKQMAFLSLLFYASLFNYRAINKTAIEKSFVSRLNPTSLNFIEEETFLNFWKNFRSAVLTSDSNKIIALTQFPFETRGTLDSDPILKYGKSKFNFIFGRFLKQSNGIDTNGSTELDIIKATKIPSKKNINGNYARIGDMVFKKINTHWEFVLAYLNEEN